MAERAVTVRSGRGLCSGSREAAGICCICWLLVQQLVFVVTRSSLLPSSSHRHPCRPAVWPSTLTPHDLLHTVTSSGLINNLMRSGQQSSPQLNGSIVDCGIVLYEALDERGNKLIQLKDESAINTPAVAAAFAIKSYDARNDNEISLEVGDLVSVIEMPPPGESLWWRGKRGFEVGFFPSDCVETIKETSVKRNNYSVNIPEGKICPGSPFSTLYASRTPAKESATLRKQGRLGSFFRLLVYSRRERVSPTGSVLKNNVFGCRLTEYLESTGMDVPLVLQWCSHFIETCGIVDGIYRLSGKSSNIQSLRRCFSEHSLPDLNDETFVQDVHCVASLLKLYFRELPDPLCTYHLYSSFIQALQPNYPDEVSIASDDVLPEAVKVDNLRSVIRQLPLTHYRTLEYLMRHLNAVSAHGAQTGMTPKNVAICWAPNLLRCKDLDFQDGVAALQLISVQAVVTEYLIRFVDQLFERDESEVNDPRLRPASVSSCTPSRMISSDEAKRRGRFNSVDSSGGSKLIDVGGGPRTLPPKYHTIIQSVSRGKGSRMLRSSSTSQAAAGWNNFSFLATGHSAGSISHCGGEDGNRLRLLIH